MTSESVELDLDQIFRRDIVVDVVVG